MNDIILNHDSINFNEIEKVVFGIVCEAGLSIVKGLMENLDEELFNSRKSLQSIMKIYKAVYYTDKGKY